jgi:hypothetical protein
VREFLAFALRAFTRSFHGAWAAAWIISSLASIGGAVVWFKWPLPNNVMNLLIGVIPLAAFIIVMVLGPLIASFRMYKDLEKKSSAEIATLKAQVDKLSSKITGPRADEARKELGQLSAPEQAALWRMLVMGAQNEDELRNYLKDAAGYEWTQGDVGAVINKRCSFLQHSFEGKWYIKEEFKPILEQVLAEARTGLLLPL